MDEIEYSSHFKFDTIVLSLWCLLGGQAHGMTGHFPSWDFNDDQRITLDEVKQTFLTILILILILFLILILINLFI